MRLIFVLFVFAGLGGYGQVDLVNVSAVRKDSSFLFYGLTNRIKVIGGKSAKWQLKAKYSEVEELDGVGVFTVLPDHHVMTDTLTLLKNGVVVLTKTFFILNTSIKVRLGVLQKDTVTKGELVANKSIVFYTPGCVNCIGAYIPSFNLKFETRELPELSKELLVEGSRLNDEANMRIMKLVHGDKVIFSKILVELTSPHYTESTPAPFVRLASMRIREMPGPTIVIK